MCFSVEVSVAEPLGVVTVNTDAAVPSTLAVVSSVICVRSVEESSAVGFFQEPPPLLLEKAHFPTLEVPFTYAQSEYVVLTPNMYCWPSAAVSAKSMETTVFPPTGLNPVLTKQFALFVALTPSTK